ncbi:MAG: type I-E CRISPR-associated endoribonuclease Cas2e [Gemmatimonadota bacterium]
MLVLVLECAPPKVVGFCSSWALQIATGVYVANLPRREMEEIWEQIVDWADEQTRIVMVWDSPATEQGLEHRLFGKPRRTVTDREGLLISTWSPRLQDDLAEPEQTP